MFASIGQFALALNLLIFGVFLLLASAAMTFRRGLARDIHSPIPNDPPVHPEVRIGRAILRGEHNRIPLYTLMIKAFVSLGLILIVAGSVATLVAWI